MCVCLSVCVSEELTQNCCRQLRLLGSNASKMRRRPELRRAYGAPLSVCRPDPGRIRGFLNGMRYINPRYLLTYLLTPLDLTGCFAAAREREKGRREGREREKGTKEEGGEREGYKGKRRGV